MPLFADHVRAAGHVVHAPDLYDGNTFAELDDGMAYGREVGFDTVSERGRAAAERLPNGIVYLGFSLGAMPGQMLAQTRPGAKGALLLHTAIPPSEFGGPWPDGLPLQIHTMEDDDWGDVGIAHELANTIPARSCCCPAIGICSPTAAFRLRRSRRHAGQATGARLPRQPRLNA